MSMNLCTYCFNNPLVYWDPTGNIPQEDAISLTRELKAYKNIIPIDIMGYYKELFGIYEKYGVDYTSIPEYEEYTNIINSYYGSITSIDPQNIRTQDQAMAYVKQQEFEHAILEAYVNQEYRAAWANISNEITRPVGYGEDPDIRKINIRQTLNNVSCIERIAGIPSYTVRDIVKKAAITQALNDMANVAADYYLIQNSRIEQLREALYYNIMIYGISSVNLPGISNVRSLSRIKDPGYYYVSGEKVYITTKH